MNAAAPPGAEEWARIRPIYWRLIPLLLVLVTFNYLYRVSVGFAALRMNQDLGFSPGVFGFGGSVFFAGYVFLQIPSNLIVHRLGARVWLSAMVLSWAVLSMATAFIHSIGSFYILRFVLGLAEGGFLPAAALYVTYWFPQAYRGRAVAGYIIGTSISTIVGGPLTSLIMTAMDGFWGISGWQWMFIAEGAPVALFAIFLFSWLPNGPEEARWLDTETRSWLTATLRAESAALQSHEEASLWRVVQDPRAWSLGLMFGCGLIGLYGLLLWLPQIIKGMGDLSLLEVGFLSIVPSVLGVIGAILVSHHSDRVHDRKSHMAACYIVSGLGLLASALVSNPVLAYVFLCIGNAAVLSASPLFWTISGSFFKGAAAAAAIAFINVIAQLGGIGPYLIGAVKDATGSFTLALIAIASFSFLAAVMALTMNLEPKAGRA